MLLQHVLQHIPPIQQKHDSLMLGKKQFEKVGNDALKHPKCQELNVLKMRGGGGGSRGPVGRLEEYREELN